MKERAELGNRKSLANGDLRRSDRNHKAWQVEAAATFMQDSPAWGNLPQKRRRSCPHTTNLMFEVSVQMVFGRLVKHKR
jgi:hypothetical protein